MDLSNQTPIDRRRFLRITGSCALAALLGSGCAALKEDGTGGMVAACPYGLTYDPYPGQCANYLDSSGSGYCDYSEDKSLVETASKQTASPTASPQPSLTLTAVPQGSAAQSSSELVVLCRRGCRAPGHCRRFRDRDGSGICDLSEGIDPSESG